MISKTKLLVSTFLITCSIASANTLVTVNGTPITQMDVDNALMQATQGRFNQVPQEKQAEFRKQVLEQLIAKELVFADAKKTGVLESAEFKKEYESVIENVRKELAIQVWQQKELEKVVVSEKELKTYYDKNKEEFNEKESVHARHILVKTEDEANAIIKVLKGFKGEALKAKFIEEAKAKSTGPTGPKGGDLGYFAQGQMVPEFNDKVFSMDVGSVTMQPVKTQFGYHVIYLEDKKESITRAFSEVKTYIEQRLKMEKFKTQMQAKMQELQKQASIK
jgi:parvulin-like peptidyl-prolyl isomerase